MLARHFYLRALRNPRFLFALFVGRRFPGFHTAPQPQSEEPSRQKAQKVQKGNRPVLSCCRKTKTNMLVEVPLLYLS